MSGGSKTFTVASSGAYYAGMYIRITNPTSANWMQGNITAVTSTSITVNITASTSSNTYANWLFSIAGPDGVQGPQGATGTIDYTTAQTISAKVASYTLLTADAGKLITVDSASATNITVNGTLDLSPGQRIDVLQLGTGQVTIVNSGATVSGSPGLKLRTRYSMATVLCVATDVYVVIGDVVA